MIKLERATLDNLEFVLSFGLKNIDNVYLIKQNSENVGVIEYLYALKEDDDDNYYSIYVEYINVLNKYRRKGIATSVINMLSDEGNNYINGNSLPNNTSVSFWKSLGVGIQYKKLKQTYTNILTLCRFFCYPIFGSEVRVC